MRRYLAILLFFLGAATCPAAELIPSFSLVDSNRMSMRYATPVNPREYKMQVLAMYFADATCGYCRTQFGRLSELQQQLRATNGNYNIEIMGVNSIGHQSGTFAVGTIPWLQDVESVEAKELCGTSTGRAVVYRDVWILNPKGEIADVINLTTYNLTITNNFEMLRTKLINAAKTVDNDGDKIPDDYETLYARNNVPGPTSDLDQDGFSLFQEFAFGSSPANGASRPTVSLTRDQLKRLVIKYKRWGGDLVDYTLESSTDLVNWSRSSFEDTFFKERRTLFDGTGHAEMTLLVPEYQHTGPAEFLRVVPRFKLYP